MNGVDAVRLLGRSLSTDAGRAIPDPVWALCQPPRNRPAGSDGTARPSRTAVLTASLRAAAIVWRAGRTDSPLVGPFQAPRSPLNSADAGPDRRVCAASIELDRIKRLSRLSETTVNDVVLTACSAALRRYLLDIDGLPASPLVIGCPTSIAPPAGSSASSVGIMFVDSATDRADPGVRLSVISRSTRAAKSHLATLPHEALVSHSILAMAPHTLRQLVPGAVGRLAPMFNLIVSNVPGPDRPCYLAGARMVGLYPLSLVFKGEALNITAVSYDGRMHLGFTASGTALPMVHRFARYLEDSINELENHYTAVIPDRPRPA
ncbi:WS/DGAT domain-containing protein [Nocardia sp. NPDC052112]|uniref:WS/DGAT domain-containing protein n=1 Tax=Nocardia sp. NPDC052112 TaxID=3155646 RepID=UPI00342EFB20